MFLRYMFGAAHHRTSLLRIFAVILVFSLCLVASNSVSALTTVPTKMNFQGRLTNAAGNIMPNGTYNMKLRLFTASTGGSATWTEDRLVSATQGVTVTNGLFSIKLGDISSLAASHFASGDLYLEVELPTPATATSASPVWTEGPMTPRNQMATSAYAYNAETLDGVDSTDLGQLSTSNTWTGLNTIRKATNGLSFDIQNTSSVSLLSANTSTMGVTINGSLDQTGTTLTLKASLAGSVSTPQPRDMDIVGNYLYVINMDGTGPMTIVDISDPASPAVVGSVGNASMNAARDIRVVGRYAYVASFTDTVTIIDVANPASPTVVGSVTDATLLDQAHGIEVQGKYAYVAATNGVAANGYLTVVDISNPAAPAVVANLNHANLRDAKQVDINGRYAYVSSGATGQPGGLVIVDILNPLSPTYVSASLSSVTMNGSRDVVYNGKYVYIVGSTDDSLVIIDVSNASSPTVIGSLTDSTNLDEPYDISLSGRYAYIASRTSNNIAVVDISNPVSPSVVSGSGYTLAGLGPTAAMLHGRYMYVATNTFSTSASNIRVLDTGGASLGATTVNTIDTHTLQVEGTADIAGELNVGDGIFVGQGGINTDGGAIIKGGLLAGNGLFSVDTVNSLVRVGSATADAIAVVTVLDTKNTSGDPTGASAVNGAMYYNSNAGKFRCYQAGWTDCIAAGGGGGTVQAAYTASTGGTTPEVKVDATRGGFDIQDADTSIAGSIFTVRASNGAGLGAVLFDVSSAAGGTVTVLGNSSGQPGTWSTNANTLPLSRTDHSSVVANGYVYVIGGAGATTVYYGKIASNGSVGAWSTTTALPAIRSEHSSVVANGYVYVLGGTDGTSMQSTVYYAKLNADGTVGTWQTAANALPLTIASQSSVVSGGYVYTFGSRDNPSGALPNIYYSKLNADGSVGAWSSTALPTNTMISSAVIANGYAYVIGGSDDTTIQSIVYYAKQNANGSFGTWNTTTSLPAASSDHASVVVNGYVYAIGGSFGTGIRFAKLNSDGTLGSWSTATNTLPGSQVGQSSVTANGYVYSIGNGTAVYYSRVGGVLNVGGSLDLVGFQGQNLADGGDASAGSTGGSITAGNITAVGTLQVQSAATFASTVSVTGDFNAGNGLFSVENGNAVVRIGSSTADATAIVLVLDTKNTSGDPTGAAAVNGAMYYNSNTKRYRCYVVSAWVDCMTRAGANTSVPGGNTIANTTVETNLASNYALVADECVPGRVYKVTARGVYSQTAAAVNMTIRIKFGTTVLATTGAQAMGAVAMTNRQWELTADVICQTTGVTGTVEAAGTWKKHTSAILNSFWEMPNTAAITVNTTTTQTLQISAQWSTALAGNTITMRQFNVQAFDNNSL